MYKLVVTLALFQAFSAFAEEVPAVQPEPAAPSEPVAEPGAVAQPESAANPEPVTQTEAVAQPEPTAATEPVASPEPVAQPEPAATPAPATKPEPVAKTDAPQQSASIFVQDPAVFHQRQAELEKLKKSVGNKNEGLDSLLNDASRIAKMNDQCAAISINDVMGEECWTFYRVELPAFEEKYMRVTGEVRLGHMETARGLEDRKLQIDACVDALFSFAQSKDQFLNLDGGVFLEPLSNGFQANYDFTLQYEPNHRKHAFEIAQKWGETCREMVVRKDGEGFAPFFLEKLEKLNAELAANGSLAVYKTDTTAAPVLFMDISKPVRSAYYLNGVKLFHSRISAGPVGESPVRIKFESGRVQVDGEPVVMKRGQPQKFKGSVEYPQKEAALNGRWIWEHQGNNEGVDFGPEEDEAVKDSLYALEIAAKTAAADKRRGVHFSPWVGVSAAFAPFNDKNHKAFKLDEGQLMILPDFIAAARIKVGFGEDANMFVAFGGGAFVGAGFGDGLQRVYIAPVAQAEFGYKKFGVRETVVIAIPKDDSEEWTQFKTGAFAGFGMFGVEAGFDFITNLGPGGYVTLFWNL
ncbi:MAG: hypothetical protein J5791_10140 [Fibrobacter sp.]|nr:hypothetical protein [Fibrobacter sp.]